MKLSPLSSSPETINRTVVRLETTYWSDSRGIYTSKSLRVLKRKCSGVNLIFEDARSFGVEEVIQKIGNLYTLPDGVYQVIITNIQRDWETGYIEDYEYSLVPFFEG